MQFMFSTRSSRSSGWGCLIGGILGLVLLYYFFKFVWWAAPAFLVLALLINWRSVANTGKQFLKFFERSPLAAIGVAALAVVFFPLFACYLFLQAIGARAMKGISEQMRRDFGQAMGDIPGARQEPEGEYVDFEEIDSQPIKPAAPEKLDAETQKKGQNPYDDLLNS